MVNAAMKHRGGRFICDRNQEFTVALIALLMGARKFDDAKPLFGMTQVAMAAQCAGKRQRTTSTN